MIGECVVSLDFVNKFFRSILKIVSGVKRKNFSDVISVGKYGFVPKLTLICDRGVYPLFSDSLAGNLCFIDYSFNESLFDGVSMISLDVSGIHDVYATELDVYRGERVGIVVFSPSNNRNCDRVIEFMENIIGFVGT